jgi:GNAT superfamily N-acetyltransferase
VEAVLVIWEATHEDLVQVVALGIRMHAESPEYRDFPMDGQKLLKLYRDMIDGDRGLILLSGDGPGGEAVGLALGFVAEFFFGRDLQAGELAIYVHPEHRSKGRHGVRLVNTLEGWARSLGCVRLRLGVSAGIDNGGVGRLYEGLGFRPAGGAYSKDLAPNA